jgi:hypothetical protein
LRRHWLVSRIVEQKVRSRRKKKEGNQEENHRKHETQISINRDDTHWFEINPR